MRFSLVTAAALVAVAACSSTPAPAAPRFAPPPEPLSAETYAHYLRGRVAAYEGDMERAARELGRAATAAPDETGIELSLIETLLRAGRRERARQRAAAAAQRWPRDADVWLVAGRVHRSSRQPRAAARAYRRAIELAPDRELAYLGLASAQIALGELEEARDTYAALVEAVPTSVVGHVQLGERLLSTDPSAAAEHLERALALDPDHLGARLALSRAQRARGDAKAAVATLREAFDRSEGDPRVGEELFSSLLEAGERRQAIELLALLDRDDLEIDTRVTFGYLYLRAGEAGRARAHAAALRRHHPRSVAALLLEARALEASGRGAEAVAPLLSVAVEHRAFADARRLAIELLAAAGQLDRALGVAEDSLAAAPGRAPLLAARAFALELAGRPERARRLLELAITEREGERGEAELRYALAALEERQGRPDHAVDLVEVLLERDPDDATALNFIGYSLADRGIQLRRARRLLARALELRPDSGYVLDSWGWLLFREGELEGAERALRRAARLAPAEPEILWHLGELYLARGERARAVELIERARRHAVDLRVRARLDARLGALRDPT